MLDLKKTAFITGGSRGIGKAISIAFAKAGYNLAINYKSNDIEGENTKKICEDLGAKVLLLKGDISQFNFVKEVVDKIVKDFGTVEVLVNNAGITRDNLIITMSEDDFDNVIEANLKSAFLTMKFVSRHMLRKRYGKIINITSISGVRGNAGQANYSSSKAGLIGMTKSLAKEFGSRGINVNAVAPGFIHTDMTESLVEEAKDKILREIPLGYIGQVEDVANVVLFLASDEAKYLTGQVICVDGGLSI